MTSKSIILVAFDSPQSSPLNHHFFYNQNVSSDMHDTLAIEKMMHNLYSVFYPESDQMAQFMDGYTCHTGC